MLSEAVIIALACMQSYIYINVGVRRGGAQVHHVSHKVVTCLLGAMSLTGYIEQLGGQGVETAAR
jgi:hypothetical protein